MADAKITLTTEARNDGLEKLNKALAEGQQSVAEMTKELNDMRKATKEGTEATKEQRDAMVSLRNAINQQKDANKAYAKEIGTTTAEIKKSVKEMADADKGARGLASAFKLTEGFTTAFSVALGSLAATITTGVISALGEMASQVMTLGAQMQQNVAQMAAMTGSTEMATEAYRALNDVYRNTNFQEEAVMNMGQQLMRMGYSAQNAAGLIQLCADASAGLGTGQQGAQQLVDAIGRIQVVGKLTNEQMQQLAVAGVKLNDAFRSLNMTGEQAMKAIEDGTLDSQQAIQALTDYLGQYEGKMAEAKNNTIDAWGDVTGNLQTMCAEIGVSIFDAFNQSEIVQKLIDFTQALVDMVRSDATGAFTDLKEIASEVLDFIGGLLGAVLDTIKLIIIILHDAYAAFRDFGSQVIAAVQPAVDVVMALYNAVKAVLSSVGKGFAGEVASSWEATFGKRKPPKLTNEGNNFRQRSYGGGGGGARSGGGGGGGSAVKQLTEEEKAIEAVVKKYADAEKQKWSLAKATLELAKVNAQMLVGDEKAAEEKRIKLQAYEDAHNQLLEGYKNELALAQKIQDAGTREKTIKSIQDQITAENQLYEARVKATEYAANLTDLKEGSKAIMDQVFGNPDDWHGKIETMKQELIQAMADIDAAAANPNEEEAINTLAQLLKTSPEEIATQMAEKGQSVLEFAETVKKAMAEASQAEMNSMSIAGQWADKTRQYADQVGKSFGDAMADFILGEKSAKDALKDWAKSIIENAVRILMQWLSVFAIYSAFPTLASGMTPADAANKTVFGVSRKFAQGGYISGPGSGTSDSIPAWLSNGEFVLRSAAVDRIGVGVLNAMNAGAVPRFAEGGSVDDSMAGAGVGNSVTLNVSAVDAASFSAFLSRGGLDSIKQALFEDNRQFASEAGVW